MIKVAIVGGGITGLAAAIRLQTTSSAAISIYESSNRTGGALHTIRDDGFLIERSADMFVSDPDTAIQFCEQIGIGDQLIEPNKTDRFSSIVHKGKLVRIPAGFALMMPNRIGPVLKSRLLSLSGKIRFLQEWFCQSAGGRHDESLQTFATRHFGRQTFERIIQPLVAGIYSADASQLSMHATMKRFVDMEQEFGSLIRAAQSRNRNQPQEQQSSGARYGMFVAPKLGMQSMVDAASESVLSGPARIHLNTCVESIQRNSHDWSVTANQTTQNFDAVLLTTNASVSAKLLKPVDQAVSQSLASIRYGSMIVVAIRCRLSSFTSGLPKGFGFVIPKTELRNLIACSFSSNKFAGRAPEGGFLMRAFIGGPETHDWIDKDDGVIESIVAEELGDLIGYVRGQEDRLEVIRWSNCMPQYLVGHLELMAELEQRLSKLVGIECAGSSYRGVGIPACIQSGFDAADRILLASNHRE